MPLHQRLAHKIFAVVGMVRQGRIKIVESPFKKRINHPVHLFQINRGLIVGIQQGQPHTAEAEFFEHVREPRVVIENFHT